MQKSNKKLKVIAFCLLGVSFVCLALALLKTTGVIFKPEATEAMKGSESVGGHYLKEESYWERYGVSPEGLVLWLDQSDPRSYGDSANWYDMSGQGNHGTQSTASYQPGIVSGSGFSGFARSFDGSNDYVDCGAINLANTDFTLSAWIKVDNLAADERCIISGDTAANLYIWRVEKDGSLRVWGNNTNNNAWTAASVITTDNWYHVAFVFDSSKQGFHYVNAELKPNSQDNDLAGGGAWPGFDEVIIGERINGSWDPFDGLFSDVRIYNRALTAAEIEKLYLADKPRYGGL